MSDYSVFAAAESLYSSGKNQATRMRVLKEYLSFCNINALELGKGLRPWVGAQRSNGLAWSSLDTYCGYLYSALSSRIAISALPEFDHVCSIVAAAHADSDTKSARTALDSELRLIKTFLPDAHYWALMAMRYTGARLEDIRRWRRKQTLLRRSTARVQVRVTKGRRARKKRRILRLNCREIFGRPLPKSFISPLQKLKENDYVLERTVTVNSINRRLRTICLAQKIPRLTTYSFRHLFVKDILTFVKYDYYEALKYTLHCGADILAAHYDKLEYHNVSSA